MFVWIKSSRLGGVFCVCILDYLYKWVGRSERVSDKSYFISFRFCRVIFLPERGFVHFLACQSTS